MNVVDYYFHTISKDKCKEEVYSSFESILKDGKIKSQKLLNNNETKFNGVDYISLASYVEPSEYKTKIIDENNYNISGLTTIFSSYQNYLENLTGLHLFFLKKKIL